MLRVSIPEGYYDSVEDLGRYVSYNIRKNAKENFNLTRHIFTFEYDEPANIFSYKLHPGGVYYFDNSRMTYPSLLFGLEPDIVEDGIRVHRSNSSSITEYNPLSYFKPKSINVHCSIIQNQLFSDKLVPILRTFIDTGKHGRINTHEFKIKYYIPVVFNYISSIEISLKDESDNPIKFKNNSQVTVVLHFRKCGLII